METIIHYIRSIDEFLVGLMFAVVYWLFTSIHYILLTYNKNLLTEKINLFKVTKNHKCIKIPFTAQNSIKSIKLLKSNNKSLNAKMTIFLFSVVPAREFDPLKAVPEIFVSASHKFPLYKTFGNFTQLNATLQHKKNFCQPCNSIKTFLDA